MDLPAIILSFVLIGAAAAAFPIPKKKSEPEPPPPQPEIIGYPINFKCLIDYDTIRADIPSMESHYLRDGVLIRINGLPELGKDEISQYRAQSIRLQLERLLSQARIISVLNIMKDSKRFGLICDIYIDNRLLSGMVYDCEPMKMIQASSQNFIPPGRGDNGRFIENSYVRDRK